MLARWPLTAGADLGGRPLSTDRYHTCPRCGERIWAESLFDSLRAVAKGDLPSCSACHEACTLHLSFAFGLDATGSDCSVIDAFLPDEPISWADKAWREVTFYPFLVITDGNNGKGAWLPYWHIVREDGRETKKYGQWAPFMDLSTFDELIGKARAKGYIGGAS